MFKNLVGNAVGDALGLSDIGQVIKPEDYNKTESDDFILTEDGEKIFFLIKSKSDEYCFTNMALLHLDGDSALSKKRVLKRYDYYKHQIENVMLETAGTIDLDLEIKFQIGHNTFSIDIAKKFGVEIADLYKSLLAISKIQEKNARLNEFAKEAVLIARDVHYGNRNTDTPTNIEFNKIVNLANSWLKQTYDQNEKKDFSDVFQKYIQN
ncbi:MAG TPA: PH domain-containing protein [Ureibacillus sp.]|nr:PH domain-containing protein [Ureibacillus sp.]